MPVGSAGIVVVGRQYDVAEMMLLGVAAWTLILLLLTIGVYRWRRILTGQSQISECTADNGKGADWYERAMRAHTNCIENLSIFAVIVFALQVGQINNPMVDILSVIIVLARICQSLVHVCFVQSNLVATLRFVFFFIQVVSFLWLIGIICLQIF